MSSRTQCGATSPTKVTPPATEMTAAVSAAQTASSWARSRLTEIPSEAAASSPSTRALSCLACASSQMVAARTMTVGSRSFCQSAPETVPSSQNSTAASWFDPTRSCRKLVPACRR